jgi:hypothetical protein
MIGALFVAAILGGLTFAVGRFAFATTRSRIVPLLLRLPSPFRRRLPAMSCKASHR